MTVIAWDGHTLAADKQCGTDYPRRVTKIRRLANGELIGVCGWMDRGLILMDWYENGADPAALPEFQKDENRSCELVIVKPDRSVWVLREYHMPFRVEDKTHASGSGRDFAAAAMHLGKTSPEAVAVGNALCGSCGLGIDTLTLETE